MSKKPRLDQIPAANLDADDPLTDVCIFFSVFFPFVTLPKGFAVNAKCTSRLPKDFIQVPTYFPFTVSVLW